MELNEYQESVQRLLWDAPAKPISNEDATLLWNVLGLAGEAGEVADIVKKKIFHGHEVSNEKIAQELGDVLWYLTATAVKLGLTLEDVMKLNDKKLRTRYPDGFNSDSSKKRVDTHEPS